MVKKRLASGEPCRKCIQAEDMLKRRGLWEKIGQVVWADETDPESEGMRLAREHHVDLAPFFLVRSDEGAPRLYTSALRLVKEVLAKGPDTADATSGEGDSGRSELRPSVSPVVSAVGADEIMAQSVELADASPQRIVEWTFGKLGRRCAIAFSGAEDVVLIDMAAKRGLDFSVFCLDTGRLHPETYRFIDRVREHYGIEIEMAFPEAIRVQDLVRKKGLFSFYEDGHGECCGIRKVEPLRRVLGTFDGWMTGQRRDQSPTRAEVPVLLWDTSHTPSGMLKANPLARWTSAQVWQYIRDEDVPYNELHDRGFISIGCEPCTRAVRPGEHERAGRWWWEEATQRECGLHKG